MYALVDGDDREDQELKQESVSGSPPCASMASAK